MTDRIAMAQETIDKLSVRVINWRGPCNECKFWESFHASYQKDRNTTNWDKCDNPVMIAQAFDETRGFGSDKIACRDARSKYGICGPDGEFFEPYKEPSKPTKEKRPWSARLVALLDRMIGL